MNRQETIVAVATAPGVGAIGTLRVSGPAAFAIVHSIFKGKNPELQSTHSLLFGTIVSGKGTAAESPVDEVVLALFRGPKSFTGEDTVEITAHGSPYILQRILMLCIEQGARMALPGEFTQRAFLNGKMDLTQAEAVADLIAAGTAAAQQTALKQLRGGFSGDLNQLREQLINFAALIELELDFSQEDVAFADRGQLAALISTMKASTTQLIQSFSLGNAIKNGVSVAIIGKPNAGKSTLLNALLNEERAIVSDIAGTTRDTIEESLNINGVLFRLIDTAGIRESKGDKIEDIGIERSKSNAAKADMIVHLKDMSVEWDRGADPSMEWLQDYGDKVLEVWNKWDEWQEAHAGKGIVPDSNTAQLFLSAREGRGVDELKEELYRRAVGEELNAEHTIVTNARHHEALLRVAECLLEIEQGMEQQISGELLALDIRRCLYFLGTITGEVEIDRDILGTIFGKFCIGK
jgi:tRNA modification GTPase